MEIKKFAPTTHKVKAVVYGASGAGKTVFGGTAVNPIFASAEGGLLSIADKSPSFVEIKCEDDLKTLLNYLKNEKHDYDTVVVDSITEINEILKAEMERKSGRSMQLQDWQVLSKKIKTILRGFRDLPMHVLFIAQEIIEKDEESVVKIIPSLNGKASTDIAYFMDIVGYLYVDKSTGERKIITSSNSKLLTKDRTNKIHNDTEPDFSVWVDMVWKINVQEQKVIAVAKDIISDDQGVVQQPVQQQKSFISEELLEKAISKKASFATAELLISKIEETFILTKIQKDKIIAEYANDLSEGIALLDPNN